MISELFTVYLSSTCSTCAHKEIYYMVYTHTTHAAAKQLQFSIRLISRSLLVVLVLVRVAMVQ
jgi:hypothetical protein